MKPLIERIEEGEDLDKIGEGLCGDTVKNPRAKAIRIIKALLGEKYLKKHAVTLGYHTNKAVREKSDSESTTEEGVKRKVVTENRAETKEITDAHIEKELIKLINNSSFEKVMSVLEELEP